MQRFPSPPSAYTDTNKQETMKEREKEKEYTVYIIYTYLSGGLRSFRSLFISISYLYMFYLFIQYGTT